MNDDSPATGSGWALFLDRDGVINQRLPGAYVRTIEEFRFIDGVKEGLALLKNIFEPIVIVTNQQGIGKGLMSESDLDAIHRHMLDEITAAGGCIDAIFYCPALESENHPDRKPATGMAMHAKQDYPGIDFSRSFMVGDSENDMKFGKALGMKTVFISAGDASLLAGRESADMVFHSLHSFAEWIGMNPDQLH